MRRGYNEERPHSKLEQSASAYADALCASTSGGAALGESSTPRLLQPITNKARITAGLSLRLDEKQGSRQTNWSAERE